jgi:hypothetical protein
LLFAVGLATAPVAAADDICANATLRVQNNSTGLPDCRAYEMVSSPYKGGSGATLARFDEGIVSWNTQGSIAGNEQGTLFGIPYHAERSSAGWVTTAIAQSEVIYSALGSTVQAETADLRWSLWLMSRRDVPGDLVGWWLRGPDGAFTRIGDAEGPLGKLPSPVGTSADLSHIVFRYGSAGSAQVTALWEHVGTGNSGPPRAVTVDNHGEPFSSETCPGSVSRDGRVIVFSLGCNGTGVLRVMARVAGSATVAVSGSECTRSADGPGGACNGVSPAAYAGAAADGSRVFFTTSQQLVNGDTNATNDLYACDIAAGVPAPVGDANSCASLTQVSGTADNARVENVVKVSEDGSQVYFVAQGVLAGNLGIGDVGASAGVSNLYLWERDSAHPAGQTRFLASLLYGNDLSRAQMTPDNRYLLFQTINSFVTTGPGADTDGAMDGYRYDARTGSIVRVSASVAGGGGNAPVDVSIRPSSAMTSDGSTVVFDTVEGLSQSDTNGIGDVYAWHDGHVSLISLAGGGSLGISASGRDIFFGTSAALLDADGDVNNDIYDARIGGGFEVAQTTPCSGDQCQGMVSAPPVLGMPGGGGLGGGNVDEGVRPAIGSIARLSASDRSVLAKGGKARLRLSVNRSGTVTLAGRARLGAKSRRVVSSSARARKAGRVSVSFALSRSALGELGRRGSLTIGFTVRFKDARPKALTLTLTAKPKPARGGSR